MDYAEENLSVAELVLSRDHFNARLHNTHQVVEKYLKALIVERELDFVKTHSIATLRNILARKGFDVRLSEKDCSLIDAVHVPSRYPVSGVTPELPFNRDTCDRCIRVARRVRDAVQRNLIEDTRAGR